MMNHEIEAGEVIHQLGIVRLLEKLGFEENEDYIFLRNGNMDPIILMDGDKPMYAIKIWSGKESPIQIYSEQRKNTYEIPVMDDYEMNKSGAVDENGYFRYGITSGNNGISAIYVPHQGLIISPSYELRDLMRTKFYLKDTNFFVPLSNGEQFRDSRLQNQWKHVKRNVQYREKTEETFSPAEQEQRRRDKLRKYERASWDLLKEVKPDEMYFFAQEQLKKREF